MKPNQVEYYPEDTGFNKPDGIERTSIEYTFLCPYCVKKRREQPAGIVGDPYVYITDSADGGVFLDGACEHVESYRFNEASGNWEVKFAKCSD